MYLEPSIPASDRYRQAEDARAWGAPICEGSHYVLIDNTSPGANVVLLRSGRSLVTAAGHQAR